MAQRITDIIWPGWEVVRKLGEGSFGGVYEIQRTLPDGTVERAALKKLTVPKDPGKIEELYARSHDSASITEHFKEQMQELVQEYRFMQELSRNSYVVHCQDLRTVQHDDGIGWDIYIQMELLTPLKAWLTERYDERKVVRLGLNLCGALNGCHQRNIIHRDIKPENILVTEDGKFKLGDFGIAKVSEKTATGTLTGTYSYMAPEVANRQHYGSSADIYSLGLVMYWMMNERTLPFLPLSKKIPSGLQRQEAQDRRFSGEEIPAPLNGSLELTRIVLKACAFDPKERYHSVQEMAEDLRNLSRKPTITERSSGESTVVEIGAPRPVTPIATSARKPPVAVTLLAVLSVAVLVIAGIGLGQQKLVESKQVSAETTIENAQGFLDTLPANTVEPEVEPFVFEYDTNNNAITLTGYKGNVPQILTIPSEIDGKQVREIGESAFENCDSLSEITIPDGVLSIGDEAFSECENLKSATIPNSVVYLGENAFPQWCSVDVRGLESEEMFDTIQMGTYTSGSGDEKSITWLILYQDEKEKLLISQDAFQVSCFSGEGGKNSWEESPIRLWLNDEFWKSSFQDDERKFIERKEIATGSQTSTDNIFLLSSEELQHYLPKLNGRKCDFIVGLGELETDSVPNVSGWWLRNSPESSDTEVFLVNRNGVLSRDDCVNSNAVRPAMWISADYDPVALAEQRKIQEEYLSTSAKGKVDERTSNLSIRDIFSVAFYLDDDEWYGDSYNDEREVVRLDIDHDGIDDVLYRTIEDYWGNYQVRFGNGKVFDIPARDRGLTNWNEFFFADLNGTGKDDIIVSNISGGTGGDDIRVFVYLDPDPSNWKYREYKLPVVNLQMEDIGNNLVRISCPQFNFSEVQPLGVYTPGTNYDYWYGSGKTLTNPIIRNVMVRDNSILLFYDFGKKVHAEQSSQPMGVKIIYSLSNNRLEVSEVSSDLIMKYWVVAPE